MAKDDYFVIVYQILAYLYRCLKDGETVQSEMLMCESPLLQIKQTYSTNIIENMLKQEFIEGITITRAWGSDVIYSNFENCRITPKGIEYLCDNSTIKKAYRFLKEVKSIVPFDLL